MKIYLVGGAVRDEFLGIDSNDKDYVVVGSTPEQLKSFGFEQVGKDFPVFLHPETKDEYALARTERKTGNKHTDFEFNWDSSISLEDDLVRRDLTINAIAKDNDGNYIDPYNGISDIHNKVLRHVSDSFKDDPLRVLRVARFAAKHPDFIVADETKDLMNKMVNKGELDHLTPERMWKEIEKALVCEEPANFIEALNEVDALKIVFPEIEAMKGVPQRADYHAEGDVYNHNQMVLREASELTQGMADSDKSLVRFAALCHDLGKTKTPNDLLYDEDGNVKGNHYGHDDKELVEELVKTMAERLTIPNKYATLAIDVGFSHQRMHQIENLSAKKITKMISKIDPDRKASHQNGEHYLNLILTACEADARGRLNCKNGIVSEPKEKLENHYPANDILRKAFEGYKNIKEPLAQWMEGYQERNGNKPSGELVKSKVYEIRVSSVKKSV